MAKDLNKIFEELLARYIKTIERDYQQRYRKAKDKEFVKEEITTDTDFVRGWSMLHPENKEMIDVFSVWYKRGEDVNDILTHLRQTYGGIDDVKPYRRIENGKAITIYLTEEEKALKKLALDHRKLLKLLIRDTAFREIQKRLPAMFSEPKALSEKPQKNIDIRWTGVKENKNEFVQLIYALHKARYINGGKGEITKIVESLSEIFNLELGKNWQSNHSASIHKANKNYRPPVFDAIKEAYQQYCSSLVQDKKKKV